MPTCSEKRNRIPAATDKGAERTRSHTMNQLREDAADFGLILSELVEKSGALTAMLVTKDGISIEESGDTSYLDTTALAALVAGMFAATREVARIVGEDHFSILLQQGEHRHIHISLVRDSTMMVVIFEEYQRIGLVRHEARKAAETVHEAMIRAEGPDSAEEIATPEFKEYALNLIDRIFQNK